MSACHGAKLVAGGQISVQRSHFPILRTALSLAVMSGHEWFQLPIEYFLQRAFPKPFRLAPYTTHTQKANGDVKNIP